MSSNVVRKLDRASGERLRRALEEAGFEVEPAPHAHFAARGPGVHVTWFQSGKLLAQGKGAADFASTYLEPGEAAEGGGGIVAAAREDTLTEPVIGSDESGKGDYFGPLVIAAVLVRPEDVPVLRTLGVRDSKEMGDAEARRVAEEIETGYGDRVGVVAIPPARYNELRGQFGNNLNRLLAWGHARAIEDVLEHHACGRALSDKFGAESLIRNALLERGRGLVLEQRVRAESHPAVAAASIVARARFLRDLERLGRTCGEKLPKGAGPPVDAAARRLYRSGGLDALRDVAKLHFRTTDKIRS